MLTQNKELSLEQIADAEKLCHIRQSVQTTEWPFLRLENQETRRFPINTD